MPLLLVPQRGLGVGNRLLEAVADAYHVRRDELAVQGDGSSERDFVYVADVARANMLAFTATLPAGDDDLDTAAFNIGTGVETSVLELLALIGRAAGVTPQVEHVPARAGELERSALDAAKAARQLKWKPAVALEAGAKALIDWMRTEVR